MKDLIIIGAGPAGITAAVYAARKKMDFTVITKDIGGQTIWSGDVENYTGFQFITGPDLAQKFRQHLEQYQFDLQEGFEVNKIKQVKNGFSVKVSNGPTLEAKTLIIASGKVPRLLNVPGEQEFKGKGITYCATCDGPLFANKTVAVIGGGNSGLDAVLQLMKICPKVYLLSNTAKLSGDEVMQDKIKAAKNVEIIYKAQVKAVVGQQMVSGLKLADRELSVQGVFVEIGLVPHAAFIDFVAKNKKGEIEINCGAATSVPGVFAAGDVTDVPSKQIVIAAGDGAKAAMAASNYLGTH
ncbi:MAG: FAD-dependent oxidoreductase [bacterium]